MKLIDDNGMEFVISEELAEQLQQEINKQKEKKLAGWEKQEDEEAFFYIGSYDVRNFGQYVNDLYSIANYFSTKEKAEEINFKQTLFRKLQRFSDENGGDKIDWQDGEQDKYFINYNYYYKNLYSDSTVDNKDRTFGQVYFISREVAEQALDLFRADLEKYFRD